MSQYQSLFLSAALASGVVSSIGHAAVVVFDMPRTTVNGIADLPIATFGTPVLFSQPRFNRWDPTISAQQQSLANPNASFRQTGISYTDFEGVGLSSIDISSEGDLTFITGTAPLTAQVYRYLGGPFPTLVTLTFSPIPIDLAFGSVVGAEGNYQQHGSVVMRQSLGFGISTFSSVWGSATTPHTLGFRLQRPDGPHYGFVTWVYGQLPGNAPYADFQPVQWAYETEPNTPIVVPPLGGASLLLLAAMSSVRRRR